MCVVCVCVCVCVCAPVRLKKIKQIKLKVDCIMNFPIQSGIQMKMTSPDGTTCMTGACSLGLLLSSFCESCLAAKQQLDDTAVSHVN